MKRNFCHSTPADFTLPEQLDPARYNRVLALIPHPDDEAIGCGGLLIRLAQNQSIIKAVLVSDGSGGGALPDGTAQTRSKEFECSLDTMGITTYEMWDLPDGRLNESAELPAKIESAIREFAPDLVVSPWYRDIHPDHAVLGCIAKQCADRGICDVLFYEVWTPLPCTHILDITDVMEAKKQAIGCHRTALRYGHYLEGSIGLGTYRGLYLPFDTMPKFGEAYSFYPGTKGWMSKLTSLFAR